MITDRTKPLFAVAEQIPDNLWFQYFHAPYDWDESLLAGKSLDDIQKIFPTKSEQSLVLLFVIYKGNTANDLIKCAKDTLGCSPQDIFLVSAAMGRTDALWSLAKQMPNKLSTMIEAGDYYAFRLACENGHLDTTKWLLENPVCLAYAERHDREFSRIVHPYLTDKLQSLHAMADAHQNIERPFDIPSEQAKHVFYLLRNLIRQNNTTLDDEILFLLSIPSVKALAHREVTAG